MQSNIDLLHIIFVRSGKINTPQCEKTAGKMKGRCTDCSQSIFLNRHQTLVARASLRPRGYKRSLSNLAKISPKVENITNFRSTGGIKKTPHWSISCMAEENVYISLSRFFRSSEVFALDSANVCSPRLLKGITVQTD